MSDVIVVESARHGAWRRCRLLNAWIDSLTVEEIVDRLDRGTLFTPNVDHLYQLQRNADFAAAYRNATIVSCDSKYVYWALALLGRPVKATASGSDILPAYWRRHSGNEAVTMFLLGARPGVAAAAMVRINRLAGRAIVVGAHGPSMNFVNDGDEIAQAIAMINDSRATCLVVGLGAPKQEVWIDRHRDQLPHVKVLMGVGASIDYEAEAVARAPAWIRPLGLEWVYRVATEPRRYARRYARNLIFPWLVLRDWAGFYRPPQFGLPPDDASGERP